ncbi:MAG: type 4a pilus biogenesis protein PilO [Tahibacter sp.]
MNTNTIRPSGAVTIALIFAGTLLALVIVGHAWRDRERAQLRTDSLKAELADKQRLSASHAEYSAVLRDMRPVLARFEQRLPNRLDPSTIERALREQATFAGVEIVSVHFDKEKLREFYAGLDAQLVVQGSTAKFLAFTQILQRDSPPRKISALTMGSGDATATVSADMTVTYFRYVEDSE